MYSYIYVICIRSAERSVPILAIEYTNTYSYTYTLTHTPDTSRLCVTRQSQCFFGAQFLRFQAFSRRAGFCVCEHVTCTNEGCYAHERFGS